MPWKKELVFSADAGAPSITSSSGHAAGDVVLFAIGAKEADSDPSLDTGASTYTSANLTDLGVVSSGGAGSTRVKFRMYSYEVPDTSTFTFVATDVGPMNSISGVLFDSRDKPASFLNSTNGVDNNSSAPSIPTGTVTAGSEVLGLLMTGADTTTPIVNNGANSFGGTDLSGVTIRSSGQSDLSNGTGFYWVEGTADDTTPGSLDATATTSAPWVAASVELAVSSGGGSQTITGSDHVDGDSFGAGTVTPGAVTVTGSDHADADAFGSGSVSASYTIAGAAVADPDAFGAGTVAPGAVSITGAAHSDPDAFGSGTISQAGGPQAITGAAYSDPDAFGAGTVAPGAVSITGAGHTDGDTFGSGAVSQDSAQTITGSAFADGDSFGAGTMAGGSGFILDTPPDRTMTVPAETRTAAIVADLRTTTIDAEPRLIEVA